MGVFRGPKGPHLLFIASPEEIRLSSLWSNGPDWLPDQSRWPEESPQVASVYSTTTKEPVPPSKMYVEQVLRDRKSLSSATRVLAHILQATRNARYLLADKSQSKPLCPLSHEDRSYALNLLIKLTQRCHFQELYALLQDPKTPKLPKEYARLRVYLDQNTGIMMVLPRTQEPPLPLLPRQSKFVELLILETHLTMFHLGTDRVITEILQKYWVPRLRQKTRSLLRTCVPCRRYHDRPYQVTEELLAPFRSQPSEPFAHTGLDFTGPIYVRERKKVYVLLFTCAVIRAVHLEVCSDMSTESVSSAYIRFVSR